MGRFAFIPNRILLMSLVPLLVSPSPKVIGEVSLLCKLRQAYLSCQLSLTNLTVLFHPSYLHSIITRIIRYLPLVWLSDYQ
jgi:hypothetical protein